MEGGRQAEPKGARIGRKLDRDWQVWPVWMGKSETFYLSILPGGQPILVSSVSFLA
jgi:hypothetical protein